jgi:hypothetical protein
MRSMAEKIKEFKMVRNFWIYKNKNIVRFNNFDFI